MKIHTRRAAAIVLALALSIPTAAFAADRVERGGVRGIQRIVRIIKQIQQRVFGVVATDDDLSPPKPQP